MEINTVVTWLSQIVSAHKAHKTAGITEDNYALKTDSFNTSTISRCTTNLMTE